MTAKSKKTVVSKSKVQKVAPKQIKKVEKIPVPEVKPTLITDNKSLILGELGKIIAIYRASGDKGKVMGYSRAITNIKAYTKPILNANQMDEIAGVGDGIKKKVAEFLDKGKMSKLDELKSDKKMVVLETLAKIWGVGPVAAQKLYSAGIRTIEDVQKKTDLLTNHQKIGLKYYEDFQQKIPRDMATQISATVAQAVKELFGTKTKVETCGSYRRGRPQCGDVDVLITRTDDQPVSGMLEPILKKLENSGFLKERLGNTRLNDKGSEMYMGVCKHAKDTHFRRIDIKVYPKGQYGFAVLYFTGSDMFNRQMRSLAETKGYTLSDHGLVRIGKAGDKGIQCENEQDVFKALGLPYKSPAERDL